MQLEYPKGNNIKASILMVDDNPRNLQVLGNVLAQYNYEIEYALSGTAALEWIKKKTFDLILLDVNMPEMDGFEFCRIFKADVRNKNIPVIFLTAQTDMSSIIQGFTLGGVDYISKPFNKLELLARVSTHLDLKKSRDIIFQNALELREKNKLITYSLNYAKEIQKALLISGNRALNKFREFFLLFKPKDIISGDFYWSYENNDKIIIAIMDCTGHGVPGALMSMLGVTFLNETVVSEKIRRTDKILNRLREKIINALGQKGIMEEVHDGMDGIIISIDRKQNILQFSGAYNSLYIIRNAKLIIMKGDRMPIGHYGSVRNFTFRKFPLLKDDALYLFSDGYTDQFGGEEDTKLKIQPFRELLLAICDKPMAIQKELLQHFFDNWKGDSDQIDDVTVLGIRI